eukprot:CAMPEP_0197641130 /NCGR_PEP_ID=MMETSP1338-20131121/15182_1 /TAXON_ID=43686 ORGANISM="Pelagodinium beii, Strain RCC1491" /NCGR_SAMPLE_ID=MMETSP1338 /ASSEMBLY_ACC=CAM_ASM_000754 /LENGTH=194 /DNA_ID=CAMNT_0043214053 /DNA_START=517 /DNA_END=1099 /DNA_ORIENTATION=+
MYGGGAYGSTMPMQTYTGQPGYGPGGYPTQNPAMYGAAAQSTYAQQVAAQQSMIAGGPAGYGGGYGQPPPYAGSYGGAAGSYGGASYGGVGTGYGGYGAGAQQYGYGAQAPAYGQQYGGYGAPPTQSLAMGGQQPGYGGMARTPVTVSARGVQDVACAAEKVRATDTSPDKFNVLDKFLNSNSWLVTCFDKLVL